MRKIKYIVSENQEVLTKCPFNMLISDSVEGRQSLSIDKRIKDQVVFVGSFWCKHCEHYQNLADLDHINCSHPEGGEQ